MLWTTWRYLTIDAARPGVGMNGRTVKTQRTGWLYYPPANETLVYDLDGNLTEDARWTYTWDAENRLTQMTEKDDGSAAAGTRPALQRLSFTYDSQSRRIRKVAEVRRNSNWEVTSDTRFLYDDWNLVGEFAVNQQSGIMNLKSSYAWGLDLSGSQQGAGGVGGLLLAKLYRPTDASSIVAPTYDGNGNITAYVELASGSVTQRLEYDAFGNELSLDSSLVQTSSFSLQTSGAPAFGFSSKYTDHESGLCYYGFRYYSPEMGRWTARDPIGVKGGLNLYGMVNNTLINTTDRLGLDAALFTIGRTAVQCGCHAETGTTLAGLGAMTLEALSTSTAGLVALASLAMTTKCGTSDEFSEEDRPAVCEFVDVVYDDDLDEWICVYNCTKANGISYPIFIHHDDIDPDSPTGGCPKTILD